MSAIDLIKYFLWVIGSFAIVYLMYNFKTTLSRIKVLEDESTNQKVKNQEFTDHQKYKDEKDDAFKKLVEKIGGKIDDLKKSFYTKFDELKDDIHGLEIKFTGIDAKTKK